MHAGNVTYNCWRSIYTAESQTLSKGRKFIQSTVTEKNRGMLLPHQWHNVLCGLAQSLYNQGRVKALEAESELTALRSTQGTNQFGVSIVKNLDLTLARVKQTLQKYQEAEILLQGLRQTHCPGVTVEMPCNNYNLDLAMVRLQEARNKLDIAEALLQAMRQTLRPGVTVKKPCGQHELDLVMVRLLQIQGKFDSAETLLQAMRQTLCPGVTIETPCGHYELDMAMLGLQEQQQKIIDYSAYYDHYPTSRDFTLLKLTDYTRQGNRSEFDALIQRLPASAEVELERYGDIH